MSKGMNRQEFVNMIIGEGSEALWEDIVDNNDLYIKLMAQEDDEIADRLAINLSEMSIEDLNQLSRKYRLNILVSDN